jgi:hypothetical protein
MVVTGSHSIFATFPYRTVPFTHPIRSHNQRFISKGYPMNFKIAKPRVADIRKGSPIVSRAEAVACGL